MSEKVHTTGECTYVDQIDSMEIAAGIAKNAYIFDQRIEKVMPNGNAQCTQHPHNFVVHSEK